jgi:hypothetical protein
LREWKEFCRVPRRVCTSILLGADRARDHLLVRYGHRALVG